MVRYEEQGKEREMERWGRWFSLMRVKSLTLEPPQISSCPHLTMTVQSCITHFGLSQLQSLTLPFLQSTGWDETA